MTAVSAPITGPGRGKPAFAWPLADAGRMRSTAAIAIADSRNVMWIAVCHSSVFSS